MRPHGPDGAMALRVAQPGKPPRAGPPCAGVGRVVAAVGSQRFCPREASRPGEMLWCLNEVSLNSSHRVVQFSIRWIPGFATSEHQTGQPVRLIA